MQYELLAPVANIPHTHGFVVNLIFVVVQQASRDAQQYNIVDWFYRKTVIQRERKKM